MAVLFRVAAFYSFLAVCAILTGCGSGGSNSSISAPAADEAPSRNNIWVAGDVREPGEVLYRPHLTLIGAINACGGFGEFAIRKSVRVIRGKQVFCVDCLQAGSTPLYVGDKIFVSQPFF